MNGTTWRCIWILIVLVAGSLAAGCVERRMGINTPNQGTSTVLVNGQPLGATPADLHFVYYGKYHFTIIHDGFQTLQVDENVTAPWYEWPPFEFITEHLIPWTIRDVRTFNYNLMPPVVPNAQDIVNEATPLRIRAQTLGTPLTAPVGAGGVVAPLPLPPTQP